MEVVPFTLALDLRRIDALAFPKDFSFKVGGREYPVPKMLAALLSPLVARILSADFLANSLDVDIDDPDGDFQIVMDLLVGKRDGVPASKLLFLAQVGNLIGNKQLMHIADTAWSGALTVDNAIAATKFYQQTRQTVPSEVLDFVAAHIPEMDENGLKGLSCDLLLKIFNSDKLMIPNETWLLDFVYDLVQTGKENAACLVPCIYFENLNKEDLHRFAEFGEKDLLTGSIVQRMCNMVTCSAELNHEKAERRRRYARGSIEFKYQSSTERSGVFSYLYEQSASSGGRWTDEVHFKGYDNQTLSARFEDNMAVFETRDSIFTLNIQFSHNTLRPNGFVFSFACSPEFPGECSCTSFNGLQDQNHVPLLSQDSGSSGGSNQFVGLNTEKTFQNFELKFRFKNIPVMGSGFSTGFGTTMVRNILARPVTVRVELFGEMAEV